MGCCDLADAPGYDQRRPEAVSVATSAINRLQNLTPDDETGND